MITQLIVLALVLEQFLAKRNSSKRTRTMSTMGEAGLC